MDAVLQHLEFLSLQETKIEIIELRPSYYAIQYLKEFQEKYPCTYIAGGFIQSKKTVDDIYRAGFSAAMTSCTKLWGYHPKEE